MGPEEKPSDSIKDVEEQIVQVRALRDAADREAAKLTERLQGLTIRRDVLKKERREKEARKQARIRRALDANPIAPNWGNTLTYRQYYAFVKGLEELVEANHISESQMDSIISKLPLLKG